MKLFEWCNTLLPMTGMASLAWVTLKQKERDRVWNVYFPWAVRAGVECGEVINVWWEKELQTDVGLLKKRLGLVVPPE